MSLKAWAVAAAFALIVGGIGSFLLSGDDGSPSAAGTGSEGPAAAAPTPGPAGGPSRTPVPAAGPREAASTPAPPPPMPKRTDDVARPFPPAIRGHVRFPPGEVPSGISEVRCVPLPPDVEATKEYLQRRGEAAELQPEFGNRFVFARLKPGRYGVGASRSRSGPICAFQVVAVEEEILEINLDVPPLRRSEVLVAKVLDPAGQPVRDARLIVTFHAQLPGSPPGAGYASGIGSSAILREDGTIWVPLEPALPEGARNLELRAESRTHGVRTAPVTGGDAPEADIRFTEEGTLRIRVAGYASSAYRGRIRLWLLPAPGQAGLGTVHSGADEDLDAEGHLSFRIQPGEYDLEVALKHEKQRVQWNKTGGGRDTRISNVPEYQIHVVQSTRVTVPPGESSVSVEMPALHSLTVRGGSSMVVLRFRGPGQWELRADVDEGGNCVVDGLPEGEYWILSGERSEKRARATVPAVSEVRL